jgi:hypothetical protein
MQMHEHQHSRNAEKHEMFHSWQVGDNKFANLDGKRTLENSQTPALLFLREGDLGMSCCWTCKQRTC